MLYLNENKQPVHMRYHLYLQYGWFLQNLGKDFIRTNMHMTVCCLKIIKWCAVSHNLNAPPLNINWILRCEKKIVFLKHKYTKWPQAVQCCLIAEFVYFAISISVTKKIKICQVTHYSNYWFPDFNTYSWSIWNQSLFS